MPELPEVETIKLQLEKFLKGKEIVSIEVKSRKIFQRDEKKVLGTRVLGTRRFGKVLVIDLDNGYSLLIHLKLTGQLLVNAEVGPYTRVVIKLDKGQLIFNDLRIFGWIRVAKSDQILSDKLIGKLGPEPFSGLTLNLFQKVLSKTSRPIKIILMDQEKISGVGNIYANDALWLARVDPRKPARQLDSETARRLYEATLKVLKMGIKYGGASDQYYLDAKGKKGHYQEHFLVYNRQGEKCFNCGSSIKKFFLAGRGTYWCPNCQK